MNLYRPSKLKGFLISIKFPNHTCDRYSICPTTQRLTNFPCRTYLRRLYCRDKSSRAVCKLINLFAFALLSICKCKFYLVKALYVRARHDAVTRQQRTGDIGIADYNFIFSFYGEVWEQQRVPWFPKLMKWVGRSKSSVIFSRKFLTNVKHINRVLKKIFIGPRQKKKSPAASL